jgi:hypothetical protein
MAERHEGSSQGEICAVKGCGKPAERSISGEAARAAKLDVDEDLRRVHLCKDHYKQYKKASRKDRELDSLAHLK